MTVKSTKPFLKPSRTLSSALWGLASLSVLSIELLVALGLGVRGEDFTTLAGVIGTIAAGITAIATGGALAVGGRHWGAKEPSSAALPPAAPDQFDFPKE